MPERPRKRNAKSGFSGNHQRSWLWGHHAVAETLQAGDWPVLEIYVNQTAAEQFANLLETRRNEGVPIKIVTSQRLEQLSRSVDHQGLVVRLGPYPYRTLQDWESELKSQLHHAVASALPVPTPSPLPLVVICDRIQDAFNFGAILRCCDGAKVAGVIIGEHSQSEVTPHVARSSSGAVNYIPIIQVDDILTAAIRVQSLGLQLVAADSNATDTVWHAPLNCPTALVLGSEAHGVRADVLKLCDHRVSIPMLGQVTSLNVAVAAGILLYEIRRQQLSVSN
jgi:23S rRNA (guanosine2251-2'-O)-methyltransferase